MQAVEQRRLQSSINVTPLVDVVLVLLIIFMVIAPQMLSGSALKLPTTDRPPTQAETGRQVIIAIERGGTIWIDSDTVNPATFAQTMAEIARERSGWQVLIKGDARLHFGEVKQAMLAVEAAGFNNVGLIAERQTSTTRED